MKFHNQHLLVPRRHCKILPVPAYIQDDDCSCGPLSALMVMDYYGVRGTLPQPTEDGTCMSRMIKSLRACLSVSIIKDVTFFEICNEIYLNQPVITTIEKDWHWVPIVGVNYLHKIVFVNNNQKRSFTWKEFKKEWGHREVIFTRRKY
jgi:hypothetical protein